MKEKNKTKLISLRSRLLAAVLLCWVMPLLIVAGIAGYLLSSNYERSMLSQLEINAGNAMEQVELQLESAFEASKAVSYDGDVREFYKNYLDDGNRAQLYFDVNEYLRKSFSRDEKLKAVFINFSEDVGIKTYTVCRGTLSYNMLRDYWDKSEPLLLDKIKSSESGIFLIESQGNLYIARNLLDSHFNPYANVVLLCDSELMFGSLKNLQFDGPAKFIIDGNLILNKDGSFSMLESGAEKPVSDVYIKSQVEDHSLELYADIPDFTLWGSLHGIKFSVILAAALVIPLLFLMIFYFYRHVTNPIEKLVGAANHVVKGQLGYKMTETAPNKEFDTLYENFNSMSSQLKNQFDRSYQEQQALQQAKIKALQSQINPHFLNNTLEIINWESRIAGNKRVSDMIEALSTMLDAALDRNGKGMVCLKEELSYVEAYLYIIRERLGERLHVEKEIDESMLLKQIPRLILQPIVENAVEHDITPRKGGRLCLRSYMDEENIVLEVEHDGSLSAEDLENIRLLNTVSADSNEVPRVGLKNVTQRLRLIYGENAGLSIEDKGKNTILARLRFPADFDHYC